MVKVVASATRAKRNRRQTEAEVEALGDVENVGAGLVIERQGARRPYTRMAGQFNAVLTERQKRLGGKAKLPRWAGRMREMARGDGRDMSMEEFVAQLSPEELVRGQIKDKNGRFSGAPPTWVPRAFHRACVAELMKRGRHLWMDNYLVAIEAMTKVAAGQVKGASTADRLRAAQYVIERLEGKIPEKVVVTNEQPWAVVLDGIVAEVPDEAIQRGQSALNSAQELRQELHDVVEGEAEEVFEPVAPPQPVRSPTRRRNVARRR